MTHCTQLPQQKSCRSKMPYKVSSRSVTDGVSLSVSKFCCKFTTESDNEKKFENRLILGEVMGKSFVSCFLTHSVVPPNIHCVHRRGGQICKMFTSNFLDV